MVHCCTPRSVFENACHYLIEYLHEYQQGRGDEGGKSFVASKVVSAVDILLNSKTHGADVSNSAFKKATALYVASCSAHIWDKNNVYRKAQVLRMKTAFQNACAWRRDHSLAARRIE